MIHGGDIYRNRVQLDFSVNINPFGMPETVKEALENAVGDAVRYPDICAEQLTAAISAWTNVPKEQLVCGNGASELFMAVVHALHPKKILIPVPSFYGYEKAAKAAGCELSFYELSKENGYALEEGILEKLTEEVDLLFLANPNNPVGNLIEPSLLTGIAKRCRKQNITLVLDECFIAFTGTQKMDSFCDRMMEYPNVIIIQAFTKLFAIPGVRLGYLMCGNRETAAQIREQLPEWNLSVFAQKAGTAACNETEYVKTSVDFICKEREWLTEKLEKQSIHVYPSNANYLLLKTKLPLYDGLLKRGILIRDCSDFRGLGSGYYRAAVKSREENEELLKAIEEIRLEIKGMLSAGIEKTSCDIAGTPAAGNEEISCELKERHSAGIEYVLPGEIEKRSFEIITQELREQNMILRREEEMVVKRVIHTSADFSYARTMVFSGGAVGLAKDLIQKGADIVTDTNMALAGINKSVLARYSGTAHCFMAEEETAALAKERNTTRAAVSMERAAQMKKPVIFVVGNAPTALIQLHEMIEGGRYRPAFIIGVPVGFVNVEAAKELILKTDVPHIINRGRKGGSNVAAAICNAILYGISQN